MKNIKRMYAFAVTYPGWHTFRYTREDKRAIQWLEERGLIDVVRYERDGQFRAKSPAFTTDIKLALHNHKIWQLNSAYIN